MLRGGLSFRQSDIEGSGLQGRKNTQQTVCVIFIGLMLLSLILGVGCANSTEPNAETGVESVAAVTVTPQPFVAVVPGEQEKRLVRQEEIPLDNCNGSAETSQTIQRSHSVIHTLELGQGYTLSADGSVGVPGVGEVGIGAEIENRYMVGVGTEEEVSRALTVAAKEGTHISHTIKHFEVWDTGTIAVESADGQIDIPYSFRRDFSIEIAQTRNVGCPTGPSRPTTTTPSLSSPVAPTTQAAPTSTIDANGCTPPEPLGLVHLWDHTRYQWSTGIWGSPELVDFTVGQGTVDSSLPGFAPFQIWISLCNTQAHGYIDGAQFWPVDSPGIPIPYAPITIGEVANIDYIPVNTGKWELGNPR